MAATWSIRILVLPNGTTAFQPDVPGAQPGQPLGVNSGDLVTWNNTTDVAHLPVMTIASGPLCDPIPAGSPSDPIFKVNPITTITYVCQYHANEKGSIVIS